MAKSDNLRAAKENKNDEFYTRLEDIISEIAQHKDYVRHFEGKTVLCNCDDPEWSNFVEFFRKFFKKLKLKKMIATHYNKDGSPSYKLEWTGEKIKGDTVNLIKTPLKGNGDFRSDECIELLKEADIVVTNPPFSIAREDFIPLLFKYEKEFIIIGDLNWVAYKTVFPLFKDGKMAFGYTGVKEFYTPDGSIKKFGNKHWFTNLDLDKSHEPLILTKNYYGNEQKYPKYENYDAIECGKVADIPKDYFPCWYECPSAPMCEYAKTEGKPDSLALCEQFGNPERLKPCNGNIGVPITYMANHCEDQFEIVGDDTELANTVELENGKHGNGRFYINDKKTLDKSKMTTTISNAMQCNAMQCNAQAQEIIQSHHYQKEEDIVSTTASLECQSPTLPNTVQNSSELSEQQWDGHTRIQRQNGNSQLDIKMSNHLLEPRDTELSTENRCITEFSSKGKCNGHIGVPITYFAFHCSEQFKVIGSGNGYRGQEIGIGPIPKEHKKLMVGHSAAGDLYLMINGKPRVPYNRIIIQRKPVIGEM